jgi:acyl carrier protein
MFTPHADERSYDATEQPMLDSSPGPATDRVRALVEQILALGPAHRSVSVDEPLSAVGLSSVDMVNLMLAVEAEFDVMIPVADSIPQNFRSIAAIEALIAKITR